MSSALAAVQGRRALVALTGAGVSVPSGIPDFRSPGGLWERFDPMEYATLDAFLARPEKVWEMLIELIGVCSVALPNAAHEALAELEGRGVLRGVVTQNIDGLHQRAGSRRVVRYHGDASTWTCLACGWAGQREGALPARCEVCGALLKPDVVFFGENIPDRALRGAAQLMTEADGVLLIGTSGEVWPFSELARDARLRGLPVVQFNIEETPLGRALRAPLVLGDVARTLPPFAQQLLAELE